MSKKKSTKNINLKRNSYKKKRGGLQDQKESVVEPQVLKGVVGQHFNLQAKWQNQKFKALVDSGATRNYISPAAIKRMGLFYR